MISCLAVCAAVFAEEQESCGLVGLELDEAVPEEHCQNEEDDACDHTPYLDVVIDACDNHIYGEEYCHCKRDEEHYETVSP